MPRGDRTGPAGMGPMTGRGMGYCAGYDRPGFASPAAGRSFGRGFGRSFGRGRGFGWAPARPYPHEAYTGYYQPRSYSREDEMADLKAEKDLIERDMKTMQEDIKAIEQRIKELEKSK